MAKRRRRKYPDEHTTTSGGEDRNRTVIGGAPDTPTGGSGLGRLGRRARQVAGRYLARPGANSAMDETLREMGTPTDWSDPLPGPRVSSSGAGVVGNRRVQGLVQRGVDPFIAMKLESHFPDLKNIRPMARISSNDVFLAEDSDGYLICIKYAKNGDVQREAGILDMFHQEECLSEIGRHTPLVHEDPINLGEYSFLVTRVSKPTVLDPSLLIEERMKFLGRLHGHSPQIKELLSEHGIDLGRKDYGNIDEILMATQVAALRAGERNPFSTITSHYLRKLYPQVVGIFEGLRKDPRNMYFAHMDPKDENWIVLNLLDWERAKVDLKYHDYARSMLDLQAKGREEDIPDWVGGALEEEVGILPSELKYRIDSTKVKEETNRGLLAGVVDCTRLLSHNVLSGKIGPNELEANRNYIEKLEWLVGVYR
ncbi:hypothetical protein HOD38_02435 [archaeon]|jgi:hypothetical protein|nr:hypothetical protein [archaeon]MBT4397100.1 hypothetical protein [archaeon]MBT4441173.1 hypothetical protein [archaeon]